MKPFREKVSNFPKLFGQENFLATGITHLPHEWWEGDRRRRENIAVKTKATKLLTDSACIFGISLSRLLTTAELVAQVRTVKSAKKRLLFMEVSLLCEERLIRCIILSSAGGVKKECEYLSEKRG